MLPDALIDGVDTAIAGIAHTEPASTRAAQQHTLEQAESFARRSSEDFSIGPVCLQTLTVGKELLPADIGGVMIVYGDAPLVRRHAA
jgi:hypothetical protein